MESNTTPAQAPTKVGPERTIEELLELTTAQIEAMSDPELDAWLGHALVAQEEILKRVPAKKKSGVVVEPKKRPAANTMQCVPDVLKAQLAEMQAKLRMLREKGIK